MKGIVFTEFLEMVEAGHGMDIVDELLELPGLSNGGSYTSVGTYEFAELASMVVKLSMVLDVPMEDLLQAYGVHLFGRFADMFPEMFEGQEDWKRFLSGVHNRIHVEVRKLYPEAELPNFDCHVDGECITLTYSSPRPLAPFAEGLIRGCLVHFGVDAEVSCELTGDKDGTAAIFKVR